MKRVIRKHWDKTNGRLTATIFKVNKIDVVVDVYESPLFRKSPADCKGMMTHKAGPFYYGKLFVASMMDAINQVDNTGF
jgi:hypothetical protein